MRQEILTNGQVLNIKDAHGTVIDDFGYSWVSVKGEQKAWHFRTPPYMGHTQKEYEEELIRAEFNNKMSKWHIDTQNMLQKIWKNGQREFSLDRTRIADFREGQRVFEAQYSNMEDDEPYERTKYWSEKGYDVTWILAPHILNEYKFYPNIIWHGEHFNTANFTIKNLYKWLKPLEFSGTTIITTLPLFRWGHKIDVRKDAKDHIKNKGKPCIYRFYGTQYNLKYKNWTVFGGCTYNWLHALVKTKTGKRM
jgi:hypothetical protein